MNIRLHWIDFLALSPLFILLLGALLLLIIESVGQTISRKSAGIVTLLAVLAALAAAIFAPVSHHELLTPWLRFDSLARFFTIFFLCIGIGSVLLSMSFFRQFTAWQGEYYFLLLGSLFGLILIGASADFLTLFLGLETLSIALYVLCGYLKKWEMASESSIKYFLMGALATAFLLYGIALVYGSIGTTSFNGLLAHYQGLQSDPQKVLFLGGIGLVTLGLAFKAAIVPFHTWAPDVYDGASTPVTAFMTTGTKVGAFAAFMRIFLDAIPKFNPLWQESVALLALLTLIYANFVALRQKQLRRFFAYSGIAHAGFLLIPLAAGTNEALSSMAFYLIVYTLATLGGFVLLSALEKREQGVMMQDLQGLFKKSPLLAGLLSLCLLTLAGIPPTAGFFAKFYILKLAFQQGLYLLVIAALLTTVLSAFYYLRIVSSMFLEPAHPHDGSIKASWPAAVVGACAFIGITVLSCYPGPLLSLLQF